MVGVRYAAGQIRWKITELINVPANGEMDRAVAYFNFRVRVVCNRKGSQIHFSYTERCQLIHRQGSDYSLFHRSSKKAVNKKPAP